MPVSVVDSYPPQYLEPMFNDPYYTVGWTNQNLIMQTPTLVPPSPAGLPSNVIPVTVTQTYVSITGGLVNGVVRFRQLAQTVITDAVITGGEISTVVSWGVLAVVLPGGFSYAVRECFPGGKRYTIAIAASTATTATLRQLMV